MCKASGTAAAGRRSTCSKDIIGHSDLSWQCRYMHICVFNLHLLALVCVLLAAGDKLQGSACVVNFSLIVCRSLCSSGHGFSNVSRLDC